MRYGIPTTKGAILARREHAAAEVLVYLLRGKATHARMADDLSARCGNATVVQQARTWLVEHGDVDTALVAGRKGVFEYSLTAAGREKAEAVRGQREEQRKARAA